MLGTCPAGHVGSTASHKIALGLQLRAITQRPATQLASLSAIPAEAQALCLHATLQIDVGSPGPAAKQSQQSSLMRQSLSRRQIPPAPAVPPVLAPLLPPEEVPPLDSVPPLVPPLPPLPPLMVVPPELGLPPLPLPP
jgi:hypothetical protein